jgi:peptide/nickel transport system permease protein
VVFAFTFLLPGDPARDIAGGLNASPARVAQLRRQLGLNQPLVIQYLHWLGKLLTLNLGTSLFSGESVSSQLAQRVPITFSIAFGALVVGVLLGFPAGLIAGGRPGSIFDRLIAAGSSIGIGMPDFWLGIVLIILFAVKSHLLPAVGYESLTTSPLEWARHLLMPWVALGIAIAATIARQLRGSVIDELHQDYTRTARSIGLAHRDVLVRHVLRNAVTPVVTLTGVQFAYLLGGTVIIEQIFGIPGLGSYFLQAITDKDVPVIQGVTLVIALTFLAMNLVVDIAYAWINPEVRMT